MGRQWFDLYPNGVNFDDGLVCARKLGSRPYGDPYVWQLTWIREIVNGHGNRADAIRNNSNFSQTPSEDHFSAFDANFTFDNDNESSESFLFKPHGSQDFLFSN